MGIVIHEFDIVAESQQPEKQSSAPSQPLQPTVLDVKRAVQHTLDRSARVWAH
jgi:hypothetical protein